MILCTQPESLRGKYIELFTVTYRWSNNDFCLPENQERIWLWRLIDIYTVLTWPLRTASSFCLPSLIVSPKSWKVQRLQPCDKHLQLWNSSATCWLGQLQSHRAASDTEIMLMGWNFRKQNCFSCYYGNDEMGWIGGNWRSYWTFLFRAKEPGRGNLWEKTGQCVCVHIPHVWPMTVPSVFSALQWSNESPDRPKI